MLSCFLKRNILTLFLFPNNCYLWVFNYSFIYSEFHQACDTNIIAKMPVLQRFDHLLGAVK